MAYRYFGILIALVLVACAQVKPLTGGPKDERAPIPLSIVPPSGTTNFRGQAIAIAFDEYVSLNNPTQSITIIPNDVKINAELRDKVLMLYWEEPLKDSTTYSIYFNRSVKDYAESNDSIMQIVFSTGPYIDSLTYTAIVTDAKDNSGKKNVVVGLFEHQDSLRPSYFAQTDASGKVTLNYLKQGTYFARAFEDQSKQGLIGKTDAIAFKTEPVQLDSSIIDTVPMRLFSRLPKPDITTFEYKAPSLFYVGANTPIDKATIHLNGEPISEDHLQFISRDSLYFLSRPGEINPMVLSITTDEWTDTIRTRIPPTRNKIIPIKLLKTDYIPNQPLIYSFNDIIEHVDTSKIIVFNLKDSSYIKDFTYSIEKGNELHLNLPKNEAEKMKITLKSGVIQATEGWKTTDYEQVVTRRFDKEFGILEVTVKGYSTPIILEMLLKGKVVAKEFLSEPKKLRFEQLEGGEYTFRIIVDENGNERWDTGDFAQRLQPEQIHFFTKPTKVRPNWEMSVELEALETN